MADEKTVSLAIYREMFRFMLSNGIARLMHNDSPDHACVLIEELLHSAKDSVLIFCRNLGADVWGTPGVIAALGEALGTNGVNVRVLLQDDPCGGKDNRALALLRAHGVEVRKTHNSVVTANFMVVDGKAYRLEKDVANRRGYACANDAEGAKNLAAAFENLANDSELVADQNASQAEQPK